LRSRRGAGRTATGRPRAAADAGEERSGSRAAWSGAGRGGRREPRSLRARRSSRPRTSPWPLPPRQPVARGEVA
jgi:hypothetical protein